MTLDNCCDKQKLAEEINELKAQVELMRSLLVPSLRLMRATGYSSGWQETADKIEAAIKLKG